MNIAISGDYAVFQAQHAFAQRFCHVVENELAAILSASADLDFIRDVGLIGGSYLAARRWARW